MALTLDGLAIGNGILTVEDEDQALARADRTRGDKGGGAAKAALAMLALKETFGVACPPAAQPLRRDRTRRSAGDRRPADRQDTAVGGRTHGRARTIGRRAGEER